MSNSTTKRGLLGRRALLTSAGLFVTAMLSLAGAQAANPYPDKPVRVVVPFGAGGVADVIVRIVADKLSDKMGQRYFVENKPGAGGSLGTELVARSPADGYTIVLGSPSLTVNPSIQKSLSWDPIKDFAPVTMLATFPNVIVVTDKLPAKDMKGLIELARSKPGDLTFASVGVATSMHLIGEMMKVQFGVNMVHVPYKTQAEALQDLAQGNVSWMAPSVTLAKPLMADKKVRALAVTSDKRFPAIPDVPTVIEAGFPDLVVQAWLALYMPAKTPQDIVERTNKAIGEVLKDPDVVSKIDNLGAVPTYTTTQELASFTKAEVERWAKVVREAKIPQQ
ncbi:MAG: transporter [Alphaproteobacteria bacterium]|jgi:tripartite-type tricarboxylate transporter receptor subunit TctC|nr:transporter [Alphaproteobacteria bacterium]